MIKLRGFFDESETNQPPDKEIFSMGGWVATAETWDRFSDDWDTVLQEPPAIDYFKHHQAKSQSGQFEGWLPQDAEKKIMALARVIDRHIDPARQDYGFVTGMKPEMLRFLFRNSPATTKQMHSVLKFTTSYHLCFFNVTACVRQTELIQHNRRFPVGFVFDSGSSAFHDCVAALREMKKTRPDLADIIGTVTEGNDEELAPLQAADLLVGQATANLKRGAPEPPLQLLASKPRILFNPLTTGTTHDAFLQGFAGTVEHFNVTWSSLMLERAAQKK
jgi:hypothetical protein